MNKSLKLDQQTFMHVKQRLDYYRLPTTFPIESTNLLSRLLQMIDGQNNQKVYEKENMRYEELKALGESSCCGEKVTSSFVPLMDEAIKHELSKQIKENNQLHLTIMTLKEELSALRNVVSKSRIENLTLKNTSGQQQELLENTFLTRERELFEELQDVKFKYNQLLDFVHSDQNTEKMYIKKLLKHKNYCSVKVDEPESGQKERSSNQRTRGVTTNDFKQTMKNSVDKSAFNSRNRSNNQEINLLKEKLSNREQEILRLHKKLQFDGLNMNRILKQFNESKTKEEQNKINQRVDYLQKQSHQVKTQNSKMKKQGGDKQALREHINKLKAENSELKQKLQGAKRKLKETEYESKKEKLTNTRKINETSDKLDKLIKLKAKDQFKGHQLQKRQKLLQNQISDINKKVQTQKEQLLALQAQNLTLQKQLQNQKLMNQYERQKHVQLQTELTDRLKLIKEKQGIMNVGLVRQNELLKQTVSNLERVNEEVLKRGSFVNESTHCIDRTIAGDRNHLSEFYKQELTELKNRLYAREGQLVKKQNQCLTVNVTVEKLKKEGEYLRGQNTSLRTEAMRCVQLETRLSELTQQLHVLKDLLELQKTKTLKFQAKLSDYDKISSQFLTLKDQYFTLQKGEKDRIKSLEIRIAELEEVVNLKVMKLEEKDIRINNLEAELVEASEKVRKANRELTVLDQQTHRLKMDKNRLEKKYSQLLADFTARNQSQKTNNFIKENQLLSQIQKLSRQLHRNKLLAEENESQVHELTILKTQNQRQIQQMERLLDLQKQEIQNQKQRQQLYEMEIRQLKEITDTR